MVALSCAYLTPQATQLNARDVSGYELLFNGFCRASRQGSNRYRVNWLVRKTEAPLMCENPTLNRTQSVRHWDCIKEKLAEWQSGVQGFETWPQPARGKLDWESIHCKQSRVNLNVANRESYQKGRYHFASFPFLTVSLLDAKFQNFQRILRDRWFMPYYIIKIGLFGDLFGEIFKP